MHQQHINQQVVKYQRTEEQHDHEKNNKNGRSTFSWRYINEYIYPL